MGIMRSSLDAKGLRKALPMGAAVTVTVPDAGNGFLIFHLPHPATGVTVQWRRAGAEVPLAGTAVLTGGGKILTVTEVILSGDVVTISAYEEASLGRPIVVGSPK